MPNIEKIKQNGSIRIWTYGKNEVMVSNRDFCSNQPSQLSFAASSAK